MTLVKMFYHYLRFFNYIFTVFGIRKPFLSSTNTTPKFKFWHLMWSLAVLTCTIVLYVFSVNFNKELNPKNNLKIFYETNDMVVNVLIIIINLVNRGHLIKLYEGIEKILKDCNVAEINIKTISEKIYILFIAPTIVLVPFIILEIRSADAFVLVTTIPTYLSTFHLVLHLVLLLAILKLITSKIIDLFALDKIIQNNNFIVPATGCKIKYLISPDIRFYKADGKEHFDLKHLCKIYDDLCTCIQLLEQYHGFQMLLTFWLMFTNAVSGITMIACNNAENLVLMVARSIVPFIWCFIGSFINDQIDSQVEQIDITIIKCLIDFKCDQTRKVILQTFKQLVGSNRLQFTACSLFHLNYSMILGTIVNVITYSIIMIQLFLSDA